MDDKSILALLGLDSSLFIVEPVINFSDKEITVHHFFAGYFSIFLIKKEVIFSNTPEIPRKKTENHNYCIKLILLTYQNRDFNPYFSMKKGLITSIKPMLSRWWPIRDSNPWMHAWKACELSHFSNRPLMCWRWL